MNIRTLFIFSILILTLSLLPVQKIAVLPDLKEPRSMDLDKTNLCVLDGYSVSLFSSTTFKLLKKFSRKGEGPSECTLPFKIKQYTDYIIIQDMRKLLVFSREGNLKYELRKKNIALALVWPVGKQFAGLRVNNNNNGKSTYSALILDKKLEPLKEIAILKDDSVKKRSPVRLINAFDHSPNFYVYENFIFFGDTTKGFYIEVFDSNGKLLYKIDKSSELKRVQVTEKMKREFLEKNKNSDDVQIMKKFGRKMRYTFPDYLPAFNKLYFEGGRIYAETYVTKSDKTEVIVMDLHGKILKRVFLDLNGNCLQVFDNGFYFFRDNLTNEMWELFREPVD